GEQLQALHLRHHRPVLALAAADLLVAVDADDEHVALLLGGFQVLDVAEVDQVEGAGGQDDRVAEALQMGDGARHLLQRGDQSLGEVDVGAEDAGAGCHENVARRGISHLIGGDIWIDLHTRTPPCPTTSPTMSAGRARPTATCLRRSATAARACRPSRAPTRSRLPATACASRWRTARP